MACLLLFFLRVRQYLSTQRGGFDRRITVVQCARRVNAPDSVPAGLREKGVIHHSARSFWHGPHGDINGEQESKPSIPRGMRDILPIRWLKRQYVIDVIRGGVRVVRLRCDSDARHRKGRDVAREVRQRGGTLIYSASYGGDREKLMVRYDLSVPLCRFVPCTGDSQAVQALPHRTGVACRPSAERTFP